MFNSYSQSNQFNFDINAVSGTLRKSHPKSKMMIRDLEKNLLCFSDEKPRRDSYSSDEIIILQTMLIGDGKALIEYVDKKDFEDNISSGIEISVYVVLTVDPNGSTYQVFTDKKAVEKYITGFVEYTVQDLFPDEDVRFTCPEDIYNWFKANKRRLPGEFNYTPCNFSYISVNKKYIANRGEHLIPVNSK